MTHAFTPTPDDPTGDRTAPLALFTEPRWTGNRGAGRCVVNTAALEREAEPVAATVPPERAWWQNIIYGLLHAAAADELCDTWDRDDLADEMARQITAEAQRLTQETEEEVRVPNAAFAALAHIRNQEPAP